jgi:hypothetical protein
MKKFVTLILPILIMVGCAGTASVEVGMNDAQVDGTFGDMVMRVTKIEVAEDNTYNTIWESVVLVNVPVQSEDYVSITQNYVEISPGSYKYVQLTVDSVRYIQNTTSIMLMRTPYQFVATAFADIIIDENEELKLVVGINSKDWFDIDSLKIKAGHDPFEGASLKVYYGG